MSNYSGTKTVMMMDDAMARFYTDRSDNSELKCLPNQYLVIQHKDGFAGPYKWNGKEFEDVPFRTFNSRRFGKIKGKDPYQCAYMDSLATNDLTFCTGPAGSGKTMLALAYAFQEFEAGKLDRIIIFTNPVVAHGAVRLGFLPGTKTEKLLETSIGQILSSKIGSRMDVETMIEREQLILMPMGDTRGYETQGHSFVYFSEAQNTTRYLMKLFLQRCSEDENKICVEGDERQVDHELFENGSNGLSRAIEVFAGEDYAGHVQLQEIYRSRIAKKAEEITQ